MIFILNFHIPPLLQKQSNSILSQFHRAPIAYTNSVEEVIGSLSQVAFRLISLHDRRAQYLIITM